jgi:hypothetical protein
MSVLLLQMISRRRTFATPPPPTGTGTVYYVSSSGSDANAGTSEAAPFQSIAKVNTLNLLPGDTVKFKGGDTFTGKLVITDSGTAEEPIVITSYGTGKPIITNGNDTHVKLLDCEYVTFDGFKVQGPGVDTSGNSTSTGWGIVAYSTSEATGYLYGVKIQNCEVVGHRVGICALSDKTGIDTIYREQPGTTRQTTWKGYSGIEITGNDVSYCATMGICIYARINYLDDLGFPTFANVDGIHQSPYIANNYVHHLYGQNGTGFHDTYYGTGIRTISCNGGTVELNKVYEVGHMSNGQYGTPCCAEAESCRDMVWQYNEFSYTKFGATGTKWDGGVDIFDGNCSRMILQYNYIHHNDGYGVGGGNSGFGDPNTDNICRYNLLVNNNVDGNLGDIELWAQCDNTMFYGNTIYNNLNTSGYLIYLNGNPVNPWFVNNIFVSIYKPIMYAPAGAALVNNLYWRGSAGAALGVQTASGTHNSLAALHAVNHEKYGTGTYGFEADPLLVSPGTAPEHALGSANAITSYDLQAGSSCKGAGLSTVTQIGSMGSKDFHGDTIVTLNIGCDAN